MGPRSDERGNGAVSDYTTRFSGFPSMGPRSDERGNYGDFEDKDTGEIPFNGAALR